MNTDQELPMSISFLQSRATACLILEKRPRSELQDRITARPEIVNA